MKIKSYKDLVIYKQSFQLAKELHDSSLKFPKFELLEEGSQIRKSSKSIPATIAEGWGRRYYKNDFVRFLIYALVSCDETAVHLDFAGKCGYMTIEEHERFCRRYEMLGKQINKFLQSVIKNHMCPFKKEHDRLVVDKDLLESDE